jgi:uncharacterized lipoprotein YajG
MMRLTKSQVNLLFLLPIFLLFVLAGCARQAQTPVQPTPTLTERLAQRDAIRHMRSHVVAQLQIVDPFQVTVTPTDNGIDVFLISYLSPYPLGSKDFEEELKNVVLQASEGFVRSDPRLPTMFVSVTSVDQQSGSRMISVDYDSAYQWFTGQINTETYITRFETIQ